MITYTYGKRLSEDPRGIARYLWFRVARIYPAYLVALILWIPLASGSLAAFGLHAVMLQSWSSDPSVVFAWNAVAWSISTEMFFYAAFPLLALSVLAKLRSERAIGLAWLTVWGAFATSYLWRFAATGEVDYWLYVFPPYRFLEFVLGALAARLFLERRRPLPAALGPAGGLLLAAAFVLLQGPSHAGPPYPLVFVPAFSLVLYWLASERSTVERALGSPGARWLGDVSYSFYLVHVIGLWLGVRLADGIGSGSVASMLVVLLTAAAVSIAISYVLYRTVEVPARARLRTVGARRRADA